MRIVSGEFRGKAIATPPGDRTRPTSDRARQAVFNILEHAAWSPGVRDLRIIDLFAGSGALGPLWLFWVAPLAGGALGGILYAWLRPANE